jgi:hypothetical protein
MTMPFVLSYFLVSGMSSRSAPISVNGLKVDAPCARKVAALVG